MESILNSIKKSVGVGEDCEHFDTDIIMHINTVFGILNQLGIGPENGFHISDASATWKEYLQDDKRLEIVKSYMYLKVRMLFDPPLASSVIDAINKQIQELEWRINWAAENSNLE